MAGMSESEGRMTAKTRAKIDPSDCDTWKVGHMLSRRWFGTVSSIYRGHIDEKSPTEKPKRNLPTHSE